MNSKTFPTPRPRENPNERVSSRSSAPAPSATKDDLRIISYQMEVLQNKLKHFETRKDFESRMEIAVARWEEFLSSAELRFERIQSQFQSQSELFRTNFRDLQSKVSMVVGWINERTKAEGSFNE